MRRWSMQLDYSESADEEYQAEEKEEVGGRAVNHAVFGYGCPKDGTNMGVS
jgi:hypothetical protein